jgi:adenylate cyclase
MTVNDSLDELRSRARSLDLVLAIDRIRDMPMDEREMASAIVSTLADALQAELCLLCLRDDDTGELQLRALIDRASVYAEARTEQALRELAQQAADSRDHRLRDVRLSLHDGRTTYCIAAPLHVGDEALGAVLLLNDDRAFDRTEHDMVQNAISQIDSALKHWRTLRELGRRQKELEVIYRIDRIRDRNPEFQDLLDAVLAEVVRALDVETGFLMLYDTAGRELELRASTGRDLFASQASASLIRGLSLEAVRTAQVVNRSYADGPIRAAVGVPLILRSKLIGVLGVVNSRRQPAFTRSDLAMLTAIASQMDTAIFESLQTQRLRSAFGQCVGPQVMERLLSISDRDVLTGERRVVTVLFSDIRGFTSMAQRLEPEVLQGVLNDHLSTISDIVLAYEGTLDKYIGDSVMCFFNAPEAQDDHAMRAVRVALEMVRGQHEVMARWKDQVALPPIGVGISTGETMMGNFGSLRRLEYTAIGNDVNLAARLCAAAEGDQVLISDATYQLVQQAVAAEPLSPMRLKGIESDVASWHVKGLR